MSNQRKIQRNKERTDRVKNQKIAAVQDNTEQNLTERSDERSNKNNWILFGFIAVMCLIWGIFYWIFIV